MSSSMSLLRRLGFGLGLAALSLSFVVPGDAVKAQSADEQENRLALVIGQSEYSGYPLVNYNDPNLISDKLAEAGFVVEIGKDLEKNSIAEKLNILAEKAQFLGEKTTVIVYLSGRFAQIDGDNIFLPVGAKIDTASSANLNGISVKSLISTLKTIPAKSRVIILDGNSPPETLTKEKMFSPGLVKIEPPEGFLISYNQRPGVPLIDSQEPTSPYAQGFLEAMVTPTKDFSDVFQIIRKRVFDQTQGALQPFSADNLVAKSFSFYKPENGTVSLDQYYVSDNDNIDFKSMSREEAYKKVISIDSIQSYQSFITAFPQDEATEVVKYNLAARREAEVWSRTLQIDTPEAYWTYIKSYPNGSNVSVARYRLDRMGEMDLAPPSHFQPVIYNDLPPPLADYEYYGYGMPMRSAPVAPRMNISPVPIVVAATVAAVAAVAITRSGRGGGGGPPPPVALANAPMRPQWAAPPVANRAVTGATVTPTVANTPRASNPVATAPNLSPGAAPLAAPASALRPAVAPTAPVVAPSTAPAVSASAPALAPQTAAPAVRPLGAPAAAAPTPSTATPGAAPVAPLSGSAPAVRPLTGGPAPAGAAPAPGAVTPLSATPAVRPLTGGPAPAGAAAPAAQAPAIAPITPVNPARPAGPAGGTAPVSAGAPQQRIAPVGVPQAQPQQARPQQAQQPVQRQQVVQPQVRQQFQAPQKAAPQKAVCTPQMHKARQC